MLDYQLDNGLRELTQRLHTPKKRLEKKVEMRKLNFQLVCHVCRISDTGHRILDQPPTPTVTHKHTHPQTHTPAHIHTLRSRVA